MPSTFNLKITDVGFNAAVAANGSSLQLAITHIVLGGGQYDSSASAATQTALVDRKEKATIAGGTVSGVGAFRVTGIFPSYGGAAYNAGEIGLYAGDPDAGGILFAVYSSASSTIVSRSTIDYVVSIALQLTIVPAGSITITIDTNQSQALAAVSAHVGQSDPHPQYVLAAGDTMLGQLTLPGGGTGNQAATLNDVAAAVPAGATAFFSQLTAPSGWVKANGAALSRSLYAPLFAAIGTTFGVGDGSTTFNVPDLRGEFPRGLDDGRGIDPGRTLGSAQSGSIASHTHGIRSSGESGSMGDYIAGAAFTNRTIQTEAYGGGETRPRNVALLWCIKY